MEEKEINYLLKNQAVHKIKLMMRWANAAFLDLADATHKTNLYIKDFIREYNRAWAKKK